MSKINQQLLKAILAKTGLSQAQAYVRIQQVASSELLPRHLAAIKFAANVGVNINRHANANELASLRQAGSPVTPPPTIAASPASGNASGRPGKKRSNKSSTRPKNQVFVVHGRDKFAKDAVFAFLRSVNVKPIEWNAAIKMTGKAAPYIGEILATAFANARAVVVLLTPDDQVQLRSDLLSASDLPIERQLTGQARPNVLFEAGMAFSSHPDRTVMVQVGMVKPFSDIAGRHVLHMTDAAEKRQEFATKLENAGCDVDQSGTDWYSAGVFSDPVLRTPASKKRKSK
jgi:predicted nucleotide-binding protein